MALCFPIYKNGKYVVYSYINIWDTQIELFIFLDRSHQKWYKKRAYNISDFIFVLIIFIISFHSLGWRNIPSNVSQKIKHFSVFHIVKKVEFSSSYIAFFVSSINPLLCFLFKRQNIGLIIILKAHPLPRFTIIFH